jgi:ABC-2 type transport system ATP-binding protein
VPEVTLSARGLTRRFGERVAVNDVSLTLGAGELVAMIGPNGAGKTTLLSLLAGVLAPDAGSFEVAGRIGWVPQQPALYRKLSVAENLRIFARLEQVADVEAGVARMVELTGLSDRTGEPVGRLSGGNQQRVNIAIGLLADPVALLLDEPSSALDPRQRERLWEFVGALAGRGTAILYSTHDMPEALRHADRLLVLDEGRLRYDGEPVEWRF